VTDVGLNQVFKFSHDGNLLLKLGEAKIAGDDSLHFNQPTDIAIAKDGSFYVSDGYVNNRIMKFSATGKFIFQWGRRGNKEGEFNLPQGITLDDEGDVYVADRENSRIQVFDPSGKFIRQYSEESFGKMCAVSFDPTNSKLFAVDDLTFLKIRHRGSDIFIFDPTGRVQTRFGRSDSPAGKVAWYHDIAVDREGNIYVGDILGNTIEKFRKVRAHPGEGNVMDETATLSHAFGIHFDFVH
jgi:peptidylamidoglycolate lyase